MMFFPRFRQILSLLGLLCLLAGCGGGESEVLLHPVD